MKLEKTFHPKDCVPTVYVTRFKLWPGIWIPVEVVLSVLM